MGDAPLGLAVAAGMLAAVNPCGFALLPAYLSLLVAGEAETNRGTTVVRALAATAAMTAGFVAVFGLFGLVLTPVAGTVQRHLPWVTVTLGVVLVGLGGWLLAGRQLPGLRLAVSSAPTVRRSLPSMVVFGAAYAAASLSCTIGPFLAIVVSSFRAGSTLAGVGLFLAYAIGMGLTVTVAALAVALARDGLLRRIRRAAPLLSRLGGALLVAAGAYVAWYGWFEIRILRDATTNDPIIAAAASAQRWLATLLDHIGAGTLTVILGALLAGAALSWWRQRRRRSHPTRQPTPTGIGKPPD
ncbi:cytochrome c biogenesis CcdA family protein [Micromonospora sp. NPDC000442]|uniref:cytochrome c biogenesis CcdA family protein n=1 Tax=Micromonospora sp. NPDC000442 TaxID=3364217 RepID=UPI0036880FEC